ncbi:MAG: hypothetical protein BBJ57_07455 [Desulfobacterales bacterium PC51MH44]|nr:MAG: hypothetical protein BBJ57_07455 [Desulfobacterales bacterium PC51MH44]
MIHYVPDRVFMQDIKKMDPKLGCKFEPAHGHFVVTYARDVGSPVPICMVKGKNGGFRQPDKRDVDFIKSGDRNNVDVETRLKKSAQYMERVREKDQKDAKSNIRDMTKDSKNQLMNKFSRLGGGGKGNSTFRRIKPKLKGTVY